MEDKVIKYSTVDEWLLHNKVTKLYQDPKLKKRTGYELSGKFTTSKVASTSAKYVAELESKVQRLPEGISNSKKEAWRKDKHNHYLSKKKFKAKYRDKPITSSQKKFILRHSKNPSPKFLSKLDKMSYIKAWFIIAKLKFNLKRSYR